MPGYLSAAGIEACLGWLAATYPAICQLIVLPETSIEGRTSRCVKIANGAGSDRHGVLFLGGVHAREIVNPDLLVSWALAVCDAYTRNVGLTFGGKSYAASDVQLIVNALDIFVFPLVNPDGRVYVQSPAGDAMWRKNRNPNPGLPCKGVDINRNYDFLWSSGIGTSTSSCSEVFKGPGAFSEPETRNVRSLLDNHPNIECMIDVHSYSEDILYSWGDDNDQTANPSQNFQNPAFNGLRGTLGDTAYQEYIPASDLDWYARTGDRMRDAIAAVRGRVYTAMQSTGLYPTTATSDDYSYSRTFVDATKRRVFSYTVETGTEFQPPYAEGVNIISEASAGLTEFCLACICVVQEMVRDTSLARNLERMRRFRDTQMLATEAGRRYVRLLDANSTELLRLVVTDREFRRQAVDVLGRVAEAVVPPRGQRPKSIRPEVIRSVDALLKRSSQKAGPALKDAIRLVQRDLRYFENKTAIDGLRAASHA